MTPISVTDQITTFLRYGVLVLIAFGVGLHAYECFWLANTHAGVVFLFLIFLWGILPYLFCLLLTRFKHLLFPAFVGAVISIAFDLMCHIEVFVQPSSSTAALILIFMPAWNLFFIFVVCVIYMIICWIIRWFRKRVAHSPPSEIK